MAPAGVRSNEDIDHPETSQVKYEFIHLSLQKMKYCNIFYHINLFMLSLPANSVDPQSVDPKTNATERSL